MNPNKHVRMQKYENKINNFGVWTSDFNESALDLVAYCYMVSNPDNRIIKKQVKNL